MANLDPDAWTAAEAAAAAEQDLADFRNDGVDPELDAAFDAAFQLHAAEAEAEARQRREDAFNAAFQQRVDAAFRQHVDAAKAARGW